MPVFLEQASAKVNLTLRILGRRPDGYHELESIAAFAGVADEVTLDIGDSECREPTLALQGPFSAGLAGPNLALRAAELALQAQPRLRLGHIRLTKNLPIAAGLGGGSADAAAVLRTIRAANPQHGNNVDWLAIAGRLGADVPVCFNGATCIMRGVGERLSPLDVPSFAAVLVNPQITVPPDKTRRVFASLAAGHLAPMGTAQALTGLGRAPQSLDQLVEIMREIGNDLERPALAVMPDIARVKGALHASQGCLHAQLSGAGPTCFGVYRDSAAAISAAKELTAAHPRWWICQTRIANRA